MTTSSAARTTSAAPRLRAVAAAAPRRQRAGAGVKALRCARSDTLRRGADACTADGANAHTEAIVPAGRVR